MRYFLTLALLSTFALVNPAAAGSMRATWYGAEMGRHARTASGEHFNPGGLTCAHRTLPFGTRLVVRNRRTGRSVVVRVNDRGPFTRGVGLDLAHGAARAIGLTSGMVEVTRL